MKSSGLSVAQVFPGRKRKEKEREREKRKCMREIAARRQRENQHKNTSQREK